MKKLVALLLCVALVLGTIGVLSFATAQQSSGPVKLISDAASTLEGQTSVPSDITMTALTSQSWRLSLADDATYGKVVWWRGSPSYTYAGPQWAFADALNTYLSANDAEKYTVTISAKVRYMTDDGSGSSTDKCLSIGFRSSAGMEIWGDVIGYNTWVDASVTKELTKAEVLALTNSKLTFDGYVKAANSGTDKAVFFDSVQMTIDKVGGQTIEPATTNLISDAASDFEGTLPSDVTMFGLSQSWRLGIVEDAQQGRVLWFRNTPSYTYAGPQWAYATALNTYLSANDAEKYNVTISAKVKYVTNDGSGTAEDNCLSFGFRSSSGMDSWGKVKGYNVWTQASFTKELTKAELQALTNSTLTFDGYTVLANGDADQTIGVFFDKVQITVEKVEEETIITPVQANIISDAASTLEGIDSFPSGISIVGALSSQSWRLSWADDATYGKVVWWRGSTSYTYAGPQWAISDNLISYLNAHDAEKYTVTISAKVKYMTDDGSGSATDKCLSFGFRSSSGMDNWVNVIGYNAWVDVTTTKVLTKAEVQALTSSTLTFDGYTVAANSGTDKAVFFDSVQMTIINSVVEATQSPAPTVAPTVEPTTAPTQAPTTAPAVTPTPIGLLPVEISVFDVAGVSEHTHLIYKETSGHIYSKSVIDGALKVAYKAPADKNNTPMWLLGSYVKNYATANTANAYKVEVAVDVMGSANSADLVIRRFKADDDNAIELLKEEFTINEETFTTVTGVFYLTSAEALNAGDAQFALAVNNLILKDASSGNWGKTNSVFFDNVVLKVTSIDEIPVVEAETKEVTNGDAENGLKNWGVFNQHGGTVELTTDTKSGTGHSIKYSKPTTAYGSVAFDLGPAIIQDAIKGYKGNGYGTYKITLDIKATTNVTLRPIVNSQAHTSATFANAEPNLAVTTQWQTFEIEVTISQAMLEAVKAQYDAGKTEAYKLILRIDGSDSLFKETKTDAYWIDNVSISYVEGSGEKLDAEQELLAKANGVKFTLSKDLWDGWIATKTGIITANDVKNGKVTKSYTIINTSNEDISLRMFLQSEMKLNDGTTVWANADGANSELITIKPGKSAVITVTMPVDNNNMVTINYSGETKQCELSTFFVRFNFEKGIFTGNSFIVKCDNSEVESIMNFKAIEKDAWAVNAGVFAGATSTGDVLPITLVSTLVAAIIGFVCVIKKTKKD